MMTINLQKVYYEKYILTSFFFGAFYVWTFAYWIFMIPFYILLFSLDFSFLKGPKLFNTLLSSPSIGIFCLDYMHIGKTYCIIRFLYVFMCFVSSLVNFILFPYSAHVYTLVDNIIKMLFRLRFEIISIRKQSWFLDKDFQYHNINGNIQICL